ncbi:uncharacterized protein LOC106083806 [Stomoxys calcitrans]|uniref:Uncharacterized protein n=1 Tax=Stomoxys calcitrans TaxID=35570 RepID=A0A1I8Q720_STOCA|nr:uncharacterized protein LOC106083806 [Stomoxys calcitrans]
MEKSHQLSELGFIDYQKPLNNQRDMRTSTYLATRYMNDAVLENTIHPRFEESRPYGEDPTLNKISEYMENYEWKYGDPYEVSSPSLDTINHIKPFYECQMKFLNRPMMPAASVSHSDYLWHPEPEREPIISLHLPTPVAASAVAIDRAKPGYAKYLDSAATTSRLDYCHRTPEDVMSGIAANDNITFWNWKKLGNQNKKVYPEQDSQQCDELPSNDCVKRRSEFPSQVNAVPNSGMTTEVRDNYVNPYKIDLEYDSTLIRNNVVYSAVEPFPSKSEYTILGSGHSTHQFL